MESSVVKIRLNGSSAFCSQQKRPMAWSYASLQIQQVAHGVLLADGTAQGDLRSWTFSEPLSGKHVTGRGSLTAVSNLVTDLIPTALLDCGVQILHSDQAGTFLVRSQGGLVPAEEIVSRLQQEVLKRLEEDSSFSECRAQTMCTRVEEEKGAIRTQFRPAACNDLNRLLLGKN